jgi:hypothetical protein
MSILNGYKFDTEEDAVLAVTACDAYYGIPVSPDDVTQHYVEYSQAIYNEPTFWYIVFNETLVPVLGEPTEFELNTNIP